MNKKELISIIRTEVLLAKSSPERKGYIAGLEEAINIIDGFLDEPQKPVVPKFVAEWIEVCKEHLTSSLYLAMTPSFLKSNNQGIELILWIKKNEETFARAWLDGYTVEKEKRYLVKMKDFEAGFNFLNRRKTENYWLCSSKDESVIFQVCHTRKELEDAGFGWVFDCPGIEIEEVEE